MDREDDFRNMFADHYPRVVGTVFWILQDWDQSEEFTQDTVGSDLEVGYSMPKVADGSTIVDAPAAGSG